MRLVARIFRGTMPKEFFQTGYHVIVVFMHQKPSSQLVSEKKAVAEAIWLVFQHMIQQTVALTHKRTNFMTPSTVLVARAKIEIVMLVSDAHVQLG